MFVLLAFLFSYCSPPAYAIMGHVDKVKQAINHADNAASIAPAVDVYAISGECIVSPVDAATHDVAIPSKSVTVERKAIATVVVSGRLYQRLAATNFKSTILRSSTFRNRIVHIDPGLRGC